MSYSVLVIPEDPTYNGFILDPLVSRILAECGRPNARITVLTNPKVSGYEHAVQAMPNIVERYCHLDVLLFLVDADGRDLSQTFTRLEENAAERGARLICCAAQQEVEAWLLAGHVEKIERPWTDVRSDVSVKENVFEPFLRRFGDPRRAGGGRDILMQEALSNYRRTSPALSGVTGATAPRLHGRSGSGGIAKASIGTGPVAGLRPTLKQRRTWRKR